MVTPTPNATQDWGSQAHILQNLLNFEHVPPRSKWGYPQRFFVGGVGALAKNTKKQKISEFNSLYSGKS